MNRRHFLCTTAGLALASAVTPLCAAAAQGDRVLVLVELAGGNDGLNTVVPYGDPAYARLRPALAVPRDQVLPLSETVGLNQALGPLMPAWRAGELAAVLGVGYPRPNRSHFRSIDIWETGSDSDETLTDGWITRVWRDHRRAGDGSTDVIVLGGGSGVAAGDGLRSVVLRNPAQFLDRAGRIRQASAPDGNAALAHILKVQGEIEEAAEDLRAVERRAPALRAEFPSGPFGRQLSVAAKLIASKTPVRTIKLALPGFDTHRGQPGQHTALLKQLGSGLAALRAALLASSDWNRVLVMTYSEFGRRAAQNGSNGTDHGTAAPHFFLGSRVRGGLHGAQPSLTELAAGDLEHRVDFRRLYATVAQDWWRLPVAGSPFAAHRPLAVLRG